jgi:hypothetical protein
MPFGIFSFIVVVDRLIEYPKIRFELNPYAVKESTPQVANRVTSLLIVLGSKRKPAMKSGDPPSVHHLQQQKYWSASRNLDTQPGCGQKK